MKILYISPKIPYPLSDGGKLRVFNHIKHLARRYDVVSLSFIENKKQLENTDELKKYCSVESVLLPRWKSVLNSFFGIFSKEPLRNCYLKDKRLRKKAQRLTKEANLVVIQALRMCQYGFNPEKTIVDIVDTPSLQIKRAFKYEPFIWKLIWGFELPRIRRYEKKICKRFDKVLVASKADKEALGKGVVLKNGVKIDKINRREPSGNNLMFLGNMEYAPNVDAVEFFIKEAFPLIKKRIKDAKFYIVGKNPKKVRKYANRDVIVTGFVKDLEEYFSKCKVFVAPLRLGSGIQNKILEALNYEIPVVTTSIVNAGVEARNWKEIILADNAREFSYNIIKLLEDEQLRRKLSKNGKIFLKKNYSWQHIYRKLDKIIGNLL